MAKYKAQDRARVRAVLQGIDEGKTNAEIAAELGVSELTVIRTGVRKRVETVRGMLQMADEGYTLAEIGQEYGVTKQWVSQAIGVDEVRGSRGKASTVDADPATWAAMMDALRGLDIPVRARDGEVDARAMVVFMDGVRDGTYVVKRAAKPRKRAAKPAPPEPETASS